MRVIGENGAHKEKNSAHLEFPIPFTSHAEGEWYVDDTESAIYKLHLYPPLVWEREREWREWVLSLQPLLLSCLSLYVSLLLLVFFLKRWSHRTAWCQLRRPKMEVWLVTSSWSRAPLPMALISPFWDSLSSKHHRSLVTTINCAQKQSPFPQFSFRKDIFFYVFLIKF